MVSGLQKKMSMGTFVLFYLGALVLPGAISPAGSRAAAGDAAKPANEFQVTLQDFHFQPAILKIPAGAQVVWTNKDEEPHTVVSTDNTFKSRALDTDGQFSFRFQKPGTYEYFCSVHPRMMGRIIVK